MSFEPYFPQDPRGRFLELASAIAPHKRWSQNWSMLRYAALGLATVSGDPQALADRLFTAAGELKASAGWFSGMRGDVRFCLVAGLLRHGLDAQRFLEVLEATRAHFRSEGLPRGETYEALACLVLMSSAPGGQPTRAQVQGLARVHAGMKQHHRFLTGRDDYPAAALLASTGEATDAIVRRLERLYEGLRDLKFSRGNQLQLATHLLYFAPDPDDVLLRRFRELYAGFQAEKLWMTSGDYDEIGVLAFLDHPAREVVRRVLDDREAIRAALSPRPSKQEGFSLAGGTAFLALVTQDHDHRPITDALHLAQVITLLQAQQAAAAAAAGAAAAAAAG